MMACFKWNTEQNKSRDKRTSAALICERINAIYNTNVSARTVRRKARLGNRISFGRGKKHLLSSTVDLSLLCALSTYIQLMNVEMKQMPDII